MKISKVSLCALVYMATFALDAMATSQELRPLFRCGTEVIVSYSSFSRDQNPPYLQTNRDSDTEIWIGFQKATKTFHSKGETFTVTRDDGKVVAVSVNHGPGRPRVLASIGGGTPIACDETANSAERKEAPATARQEPGAHK